MTGTIRVSGIRWEFLRIVFSLRLGLGYGRRFRGEAHGAWTLTRRRPMWTEMAISI